MGDTRRTWAPGGYYARRALLAGGLCLLWGAGSARAADPDFESAFGAIVARRCAGCHNAAEPKGALDLTGREGLLRGGDSGSAIVAGKPGESLLIERVTEGSMPPPKHGKRLTPDEVASLTRWVEAGARWPEGRVLDPFDVTTEDRAGRDWWALQPVQRPEVPAAAVPGWARNPVDAFILQKLHDRGLAPAPEADRLTYLRRAKFDLLGLPPTPAEMEEFLRDESPEAYARLIDRLLASPHYGERWGRHWLDVARFGESDGFENDKLREHAWRYRDYVIRSFNDDKPYSQFIREQLAGDVLAPVTRDGIAASGFLVAGPWDEVQNVGRSQLERMRTHEEQLEELIGAVSQTFLGMTVNCARCHDHKFDPILQTDYYRLKAVFDGVDHGNRPLYTPEEQQAHDAQVAPLQARIGELQAQIEQVRGLLPGHALPSRTDAPALAEGKFGRGLDARVLQAETRSRIAFHEPSFTVECWTRLRSKGGFNILVADSLKESTEHWEIYSYAGSGEFSAYLPGFAPAEIKSGVDITDDQWHHVALAFDGKRALLYVDGRLVKEQPVARQKTGGPIGSLYFGSYPPHKIMCDGLVDEVRLSRGMREFAALPERAPAADEQTLGLWHFDELTQGHFADAAAPPGDARVQDAERQLASLTGELDARRKELAALVVPLTYSGVRRQPPPTTVYLRGDIQQPGPAVTPGGVSAIRTPAPDFGLAAEAPEAERRLRFADWVADPANPLTSRVLVNRLWQYHFGQGLVDTPSDLGFNGGTPSHPELLDWLASEFVDPQEGPSAAGQGGRLKRMHKLIMLSATYRQSSRYNPEAAALDAENGLLWRFAPRRLEAEIVRDAMLAVAGDLNPQVGGPSFRPFTVTAILTQFYHPIDPGTPEYNRRTVYRINVNTAKSPLLDTLDCPAPSISIPKRRSTTTSLQALALMNDTFVLRESDHFAQAVRQGAGEDLRAQVAWAYRAAFTREPAEEELTGGTELARTHGLPSLCWVLVNSSEFLYIR